MKKFQFPVNYPIFLLLLARFLLPFIIHAEFEPHRDEYLYFALGQHLDWGYLEVPPFIAVLARLATTLFGNTELAVRFFPAVAGTLILYFTAALTGEFGGGRYARFFAAFSVFIAPTFLGTGFLFQPVIFDQLFWLLAILFVFRAIKRNEPKYWLVVGIVAGIGFLNKYTMLLFGVGILAGLLFSSYRKVLSTRWPWLAFLLTIVIVTPNLIWQFRQDWPVVQHMLVLSQSQLSNVEPVGFILMQILGSFWVFPVWSIGLLACVFADDYRMERIAGWFYLTVFTVLLILAGKPYYLLPAYLPLFAVGACVIEKVIVGKRLSWLRISMPVFLFLGNSGTFAYGLPFLSIQQFEVYAAFMADKFALTEPLRWEDGELHSVRQDYADMLGWQNQVAVVKRIYSGLSVDEQKRCAILASNYGQAGAIDFYGQRYGLPGAVSFSSSYYLWGARSKSGEILITVGFKPEWLSDYYQDVRQAVTITHPHARENNVPVLVCHRPYSNRTLQDIWPEMEKYRY